MRVVKPKPNELSGDAMEEDILTANIFVRYAHRPSNGDFNNMSLYEFASRWRYSSRAPASGGRRGRKPNDSFKLKDNLGWIVERSREAVVLSPYMTPERNGDEYYYVLLCLYLPWRDDSVTAFKGTHDN